MMKKNRFVVLPPDVNVKIFFFIVDAGIKEDAGQQMYG
jgi:hypothetical protein